MAILQRLARMLRRRRAVLVVGVSCPAATIALLLAGQGAGAAADAASAAAARYGALSSTEPSGLTLVSSHSAAAAPGAGPRPTWPLEPPEGASPHWPDASTIRRLPLPVAGLSGWIAASLEGGICVLVYDREAVAADGAVYSSCSGEGRLDRGATVDVSELPGRPGVSIAVGVVPDGVTAVTATLADGKSETLPVHDNAWARESEEPIAVGQPPAWTTGG